LGIEPSWTDNAEELLAADKVIFPGQGEASHAMAYLRERELDKVILDMKQPVLGICIGQQLLCRHSEEGNTDCLGVFPMDVKRFQPQKHEDKIPQMGWNSIYDLKTPLFKDVNEKDFVYFVHSYYVPLCDFTIAETNYIQPYSSSLHKGNFYATQFHPEKSGSVGERILRNFIELKD
jgi:glutamine amidotransferase